jgi:DNA-binding NtrC family response regulator
MSQNKPEVYVVDDERVIAETLALILNRAGFRATAFADPREALKADSKSSLDLLISDVVMPGMSGIDLAIEFCRRYPKCEVLLLSGQGATADLLDKARNQGYGFEILTKPVQPDDLLAKLSSRWPGKAKARPANIENSGSTSR